MKRIGFVDAISGSGKTEAAIKLMVKEANLGDRFVLVQPTKELIDRTVQRIRSLDKTLPVTPIYKEDDGASVTRRIHSYLDDCGEPGILIITFAAFQQLQKRPYAQRRHFSDFHLIVDECPQIFRVTTIATKRLRNEVIQYLDMKPGDKGGFSEIAIKTESANDLELLLKECRKDEGLKALYHTVEALTLGMKTWVSAAHYERFCDGITSSVTLYHAVGPAIFNGFKSVTVMGANFKSSELYQLWSHWGVQFSPARGYGDLLKEHPEEIGGALDIYYLCDEWSQTLKKKEQHIFERELRRAVTLLFGPEPFIYTINSGDNPRLVEGRAAGKYVSPIAHGQNDFRMYDNVAVFGHFNISADQKSFLHHVFNMSADDVWDLRNKDIYYQFVCRTSLRSVASSTPDQVSRKIIIVMDKDMAFYLQSLFLGSRVHKFPSSLIDQIKIPVRGRRPTGLKAATVAERKKKSRDQNRVVEVKRKFEILQGIYIAGQDQKCHGMSHKFTLKNDLKVPKEKEEWPFSLLGKPRSKSVWLHEVNGWDGLAHYLEEKSKRYLSSKEDNILFSVTKFIEENGYPRGRKLDDVEHSRALLMDMDSELNCCPMEFANLLCGIEMIIYSSFSSTAYRRRWRVVLRLSRQVTDEEYNRIAKDLLAICESHGFPFDRSKKRSNDFMYLPGHGVDEGGFFFHRFEGQGRGALDVDAWLHKKTYGETEDPDTTRLANFSTRLVEHGSI